MPLFNIFRFNKLEKKFNILKQRYIMLQEKNVKMREVFKNLHSEYKNLKTSSVKTTSELEETRRALAQVRSNYSALIVFTKEQAEVLDKQRKAIQQTEITHQKLNSLVQEQAASLELGRAERVKQQNEIDRLNNYQSKIERMEAIGLDNAISKLKEELLTIKQTTELAQSGFKTQELEFNYKIQDLSALIASKKTEIIQLDETILLQSFGFYEPKYEMAYSSQYKVRLAELRNTQAQSIKEKNAVYGATEWTVNGSVSEGKKLIRDYVKLILRAFNHECDYSIANVKFNTVYSMEKKIKNAFEAFNKLGQQMSIIISDRYLQMKLQELYLNYEYKTKLEEEKEERRRIRVQLKEEAKLRKEIELSKLKHQKEKTHFEKALSEVNKNLEVAYDDDERLKLLNQQNIYLKNIVTANENLDAAEKREQNTRAGYVYIISNIGSFGEDVYKIGVTRRLDPYERVYELGNASVPFKFDVHALIFSEDAPALENALHRSFSNQRVNLINRRREFFKVSLEEIQDVVNENFDKHVEFKYSAEAQQYRETLAILQERNIH